MRLFDLGMTAGFRIYSRIIYDVYFYGDFRYGLGFVDVDKLDSGRSINNGLGMNLGLSFPLHTFDVVNSSSTFR